MIVSATPLRGIRRGDGNQGGASKRAVFVQGWRAGFTTTRFREHFAFTGEGEKHHA